MPVAERCDPAICAPGGWPLRVGDRVTEEDRDRVRKEFLSPDQWAIHVGGEQLQAARWDWPDEPHDYSRLVYAGHFPATTTRPIRSRQPSTGLPSPAAARSRSFGPARPAGVSPSGC